MFRMSAVWYSQASSPQPSGLRRAITTMKACTHRVISGSYTNHGETFAGVLLATSRTCRPRANPACADRRGDGASGPVDAARLVGAAPRRGGRLTRDDAGARRAGLAKWVEIGRRHHRLRE